MGDKREITLKDGFNIFRAGIEYFHGIVSYKENDRIKIFKTLETGNKTGTDKIEKIINGVGKFGYVGEIDEIIMYGYK